MKELWTKNKMPMSWFICWLFDEDCSHYSLEFSDGIIIQSNLFGVHPSETLEFHRIQTVVHEKVHNISAEQEQQIQKYIMLNYADKSYDWKAIPYLVWCGLMHKYFKRPYPKVGNGSSGIFCHEMRALINPWVEPKISGDLSISTPHKVWDMVK